MFTGIIAEVGRLRAIRGLSGTKVFTIEARKLGPLDPGESVAVNGVCLTVTESGRESFTAEVSPQSLALSNLGKLAVGDPLNLERALRPSDRFGGHLVQGHVDGVGQIRRIESEGNTRRVWISAPPPVARYLVSRGSVAVEGVSLTVADLTRDQFAAVVIPFTWENTNLKEKSPGSPVNLEADLIGKYVEKFFSDRAGAPRPRFED